jgi:hypothetical protein
MILELPPKVTTLLEGSGWRYELSGHAQEYALVSMSIPADCRTLEFTSGVEARVTPTIDAQSLLLEIVTKAN